MEIHAEQVKPDGDGYWKEYCGIWYQIWLETFYLSLSVVDEAGLSP